MIGALRIAYLRIAYHLPAGIPEVGNIKGYHCGLDGLEVPVVCKT